MLKKAAALAAAFASGTNVERDYDVGRQIASGGPGFCWKIHQATKKSNGQVGADEVA